MDRADIHALRQVVAALTEPAPAGSGRRIAFGAAGPDMALGGGLSRGALHEIIAAGGADAPAASGFTLALCLRAGLRTGEGRRSGRQRYGLRDILWLRERLCEIETGKLYPPAFAQMGLDPDRLVQIRLGDTKSVLRAGVEAARCAALSALVIEPWGNPPLLDLTATRRLALAAEKSGVALFLLRPTGESGPSVAETRWRVGATPSRALDANAPGSPAFEIELLRHRGGRDGLSWRVEWNSERQCFDEEALLRPVVSASSDRPARAAGAGRWRRTG